MLIATAIHSLSKVNDTIQVDLETGKVTDFTGNLYVVTWVTASNLERIGVIINRERHPGSFNEFIQKTSLLLARPMNH